MRQEISEIIKHEFNFSLEMQNENYELAKLVKGGKRWYIKFKCFDVSKNKVVLKRKYLDKYKSDSERLKEAEKQIKAINQFLKKGAVINNVEKKKEKSFISALNSALDAKKYEIDDKTVTTYQRKITLLNDFLVERKMSHFTAKEIQANLLYEFRNTLLEANLKKITANAYIDQLSIIANDAINRKLIDFNPFTSLKSLKTEISYRNRAFSDEQRLVMLNEIKHDTALYLTVQLQYYCFMRPNEIRLLKIGDVDVKNQQIRVLSENAKGSRERFTSIPSEFLEYLNTLNLEQYSKDLYLLTFDKKEFSKNRMYRRHETILKRKKLNGLGLTLYSWKHTGVTSASRSGISPFALQRQGGWSSLEMMFKYLKSLGLFSNDEIILKMPSIFKK